MSLGATHMAQEDREYICSVTLMILGEKMEPDSVSTLLRLRPNKSWRRGTQSAISGNAHQWSGWKKFAPPSIQEKRLETQLAYWVKTLDKNKDALRKLVRAGSYCALDCFITTEATASIIVEPKMQRAVSLLGLDLRLSFFAHNNVA